MKACSLLTEISDILISEVCPRPYKLHKSILFNKLK